MRDVIDNIWTSQAGDFRIEMNAEAEHDLDLSWDEDGSVARAIDSGDFIAFCAVCRIYWRDCEVAADYLGGCIYRSLNEFRDHIGLAEKSRTDGCNYGSYFAAMVRTACSEARDHIRSMGGIYLRDSAT